jgi:pimeloyl-ACP methyl ester carboxylesterase
MLREIWSDAPFIRLPGVGHFAQEDAPETLVVMIPQFVATN